MALNLWKLGGQPTSYNPLPETTAKVNLPNLNNYSVRLKAKSPTNQILRITNRLIKDYDFKLTTEFETITVDVGVIPNDLQIKYYNASKYDIIIQDIELVQKPLPKPTINGIDGFLSGKWRENAQVLSSSFSIADDRTVSFLPSSQWASVYLGLNTDYIPCLPNTAYMFSASMVDGNGAYLGVNFYDKNKSSLGSNNANSNILSHSFTTPSNCYLLAPNFSSRATNGFDICTFKRPMLNLGPIPAPYEPKRGERMIMPVPRKNLFDNERGQFGIPNQNWAQNLTRTASKTSFTTDTSLGGPQPKLEYLLPAMRGKTLTVSVGNAVSCRLQVIARKGATGGVNQTLSANSSFTFIVPLDADTFYFNFTAIGVGYAEINNVQLEEGTVATPFEPYAVQMNPKPKKAIPKPKTGLSFNGVADYLQLPSMTINAIEIDCLIDSVQVQSSYLLMDFRTSATGDNYINEGSRGTNINTYVNGSLVVGGLNNNYPKNTRIKMRAEFITPVTNSGKVFSRFNGANNLKGVLYKVTCYLNGQVVVQYDFENPNSIVGDKVLPNAKNLIPSFEDERWILHPNFKVLGKDITRLEATANQQKAIMPITVKKDVSYLIMCKFGISTEHRAKLWRNISSGNPNTNIVSTGVLPYVWKSDTDNEVYFSIENQNVTGSFDFIRPQLYELDGKEGTLYGKPVQLLKQSKRNLYSKR